MPRNIILPHRHSTMALIGLHWDIYAVSGTSPADKIPGTNRGDGVRQQGGQS